MRVTGRLEAGALAALAAGQLDAARRLVAEGLAQCDDLHERAGLVRLQARLSTWSGPIAMHDWASVVEMAEQLADTDPQLAATMLCDAAVLAAFTRQMDLAEVLAARALTLTDGEGLAGSLAATDLGIAYALTGRLDDAAPLLECAAELIDADVPLVEAGELLLHAVLALVVQERYEDAADTTARFLVAARPLGAMGLLPLPLCLLAQTAWKAGRWEQSRLAAAEARTLAQASGEVALELYAEAMLALVAGASGRAEACQRHVRRTLELSDATGIGTFRVTAHMARVQLALGLDRPAEALAPLRDVSGLLGGARRVGLLNWHCEHIDVLCRLGRTQEASAVCASLVQEAPGSRWDSAVLLRCQGLLASDDDQAVGLLRASVQALDWQPFERARSQLRLAQRLAAAGQDHCMPAHEALAAFEGLRAAGWAAQARTLVTGTPPAPRRRATDRPDVVPQSGQRAASAVQAGQDAGAADIAAAAAEVAAEVAAETGGVLELQLLGGFAVLRDGAPLPVPAGTSAQAVKVIALAGGRTSADALVEALWAGAEPGRGRARLRNVLARARGEGVQLTRQGDDIALPPGTYVDVLAFLDEAAAALAGTGPDAEALARRAVERYAGELLPGDRYQEWAVGPRERVRTRYLQLLDRLAADASARGDFDDAAVWWERALDVEAYDDDRYVAAARALAAAGRRGPAHRIVRRGLSALDRLGVTPSPALTALADDLGR